MSKRFLQSRIALPLEGGSDGLKIKKLVSLIETHPYYEEVKKFFKIDEIFEDVLFIDHIGIVFNRILAIVNEFERFSITASIKDITLSQSSGPIDGINETNPLMFNFKEILGADGEITNISCYAIYDSKNSFYNEYDMAKYANNLYNSGLAELAHYNVEYFKKLAETEPARNKQKSYRILKNKNQLFLRGITSLDKYYEYGVDFSFVVGMLLLYKDIKVNKGNQYMITSASISESKLELIVSEKSLKDAGEFGKVSSSIIISTNDLGTGSMNFTNILRVGHNLSPSLYLFPKSEEDKTNKVWISHSTGPKKAIENLNDVYGILNDSDQFIKDLNEVKAIKNPDELRARIFFKLNSPRSAFKGIITLTDIFKNKIENEIKGIAKLIEMCQKAEELEIDYDLKDRLRYIISDILLSGFKRPKEKKARE